jgi:hypothetical protein
LQTAAARTENDDDLLNNHLGKDDKKLLNQKFMKLSKSKKLKKASKMLQKGKDKTVKKKQRKSMKSKRERHNHPGKK